MERHMTNRETKWMAVSEKIREGEVLCIRSDNWVSSDSYSERKINLKLRGKSYFSV